MHIFTISAYQFHNKVGLGYNYGTPSVSETQTLIFSLLNLAEVVYTSTFGLRFYVTYLFVDELNTRPYSATADTIMLNDFRRYWNTPKSPPQIDHTKIDRNIAYLLTAKSGQPGYAMYVGRLHNPANAQNSDAYAYNQYASTEHCDKSTDGTWITMAHEIGHLLGAYDIRPPYTDGSLMCQGGKTPANVWFSNISKNEINYFLNLHASVMSML